MFLVLVKRRNQKPTILAVSIILLLNDSTYYLSYYMYRYTVLFMAIIYYYNYSYVIHSLCTSSVLNGATENFLTNTDAYV